MNFKLPKNERLHSKKLIKELFDKGSSFFLYPFKAFYFVPEEGETNQVLFSVSKKKIKSAVKRNLVKRRFREAYRLNKHLLTLPSRTKLVFALVYVSDEMITFDKAQIAVRKLLKKISKEMESSSTQSRHDESKE
ncbi:ribonuclease P protein component [Pararhodonellum marinum]|uniref:ribonuclease P protein component n=1 Tax=Pararhodonellum marinum TaxID=2755358 RepID=UPI00188E0621|nr:ribonuclease P protein component [Pararhodonellum marinum]